MVNISFKESEMYINNSNDRIIYIITETLRNYIHSLEQVSKFPIARSENGTASYIYKYLSNQEYNTMDKYRYYREVQTNCQRLLDLYPFIKNIIVYDINGDGIFMEKGEIYATVKNQYNATWFNDTLFEKGRIKILNYKDLEKTDIGDEIDTIFVSRAIVNAERIKNIGITLVSADISSLNRFFNSNRVFDSQRVGVYTLGGKRLMGDIDVQTFNNVYREIKRNGFDPDNFAQTNGSLKVNISGTTNIYNYSTFYNNYLCITETPNRFIITNTLKKQRGIFMMLVILLISTITVANMIVKSITRPIAKLVKACKNIQSGDFSVHIPEEANDELAEFTLSFNTMAKEINTLIQEVYMKDVIKGQIEIQMLMGQINPHFLYNTLENIRTTAYVKGEYKLSEMASLLGKTLRFGISVSDKVVTVQRELETLQDYIKLQKLHYENRISFHINVDKMIFDYQIIKLILQPIVENAIYHGINTVSKNGTISILGFYDEENIIFKVIDNGIGIEQDLLEKLNDYINEKNEYFKSIGLKNVNRRIQLYYGKKYGIKVDSVLGKGTMVTVTLPTKPVQIS